jgi:hypothetical protein
LLQFRRSAGHVPAVGSDEERPVAGYEQFLDIAGGDRAMAKLLHESLKKLEQGAGGPDMQEMAADVLAGRIGLREAANSSAYAEAFRESMTRLQSWMEEVGPEEVDRMAAEAAQYAAELRTELDHEPDQR